MNKKKLIVFVTVVLVIAMAAVGIFVIFDFGGSKSYMQETYNS